ncbi:hypothetical protein HX900_28070 [Rhizobium sp. WYCCWR 11290]|uniref:Uncharacterized protein n=1 Tax=Rhizobium changzhiense TaxID=2692317 RepID=A0A7Z0UFN4_9HYPH|nr:hypothetical protein [Rhizobium changzhiense]NZD64935.1 hypothetical protein [Rhizobium changzhiense]
MSVLYHISQEDEYRLVHCSNASRAILCSLVALALPFFLAESTEHSLPPGVLAVCQPVARVFPPYGSHAAVQAMHFNNA